MTTMKQIAQVAGVSTATVSRVLNGASTISVETTERVNAIMRELNYRPNHVARSLRTVSTRTLGVLVSNVANPFFASLVRSIEDAASEIGLGLLLGNASEQPERQISYLHSFLEKQVDGMIVTPTGTSTDWAEEMLERKLPLVFVDRTLDGIDVPSVTIDHDAALGELIDHFISFGHRSAAFISGPLSNTPIRRRISGLLEKAHERGLEVRPEHIIEGGVLPEDGSRAVHDLLAIPGPRPDVVLTLNGTMTLGALRALSKAGLRIPEDIAMASYDDSPWLEVLNPAVTAIAQPTTDMGRVAVSLISRMIAGEDVESVTLPASFIARGSCGPIGNRATAAEAERR